MKNIYRAVITMLVLALLAVSPAAALADSDTELTVNGTSIISLEPDYARITAGYSAENKDIRIARDETAIKMDGIIAALRTLGIEDKDIVTSSFNVDSVYDYTKNYTTVIGYRVNSNITITVRNIDQVASVLNAVFEAGSNQSYGLEFRSTKEGEAYREALKDAIRVAREKAELMAGAAGVRLSKLVSVSEQQNVYAPTPMYANSRLEDSSAGAVKGLGDSVMTGTLDISAQVTLRYELGD